MSKIYIVAVSMFLVSALPLIACAGMEGFGGGEPRREGGQGMRGPDFSEMAKDIVEKMDTDNNGTVDEAEYLSYYKAKFAEIDEDANKAVTSYELESSLEDDMPKPPKRR